MAVPKRKSSLSARGHRNAAKAARIKSYKRCTQCYALLRPGTSCFDCSK